MQTQINLKLKLKHNGVQLPTYATSGAGCFDIRADTYDKRETSDNEEWSTTIGVNESIIFGTGLFFEVPKGKVLLVFSRSGHGFNKSIRLANCVGVIDSDYRGELKVKLTKDSIFSLFVISKGDRIAQAMLVDSNQVQFEIVEELSDTERGVGGLGSTGIN